MIIESSTSARRTLDPTSETESGAFFYGPGRKSRLWVSAFCLQLLRERGAFTVDTVAGPHGRRIITTTWRLVGGSWDSWIEREVAIHEDLTGEDADDSRKYW